MDILAFEYPRKNDMDMDMDGIFLIHGKPGRNVRYSYLYIATELQCGKEGVQNLLHSGDTIGGKYDH